MTATVAAPVRVPKHILPRRSSKRDREVWAELDAVLNQARMWMFDPPIWSNDKQGGLTCSVQGLAFTATSTPNVFAIVPYGYSLKGVIQKKLVAAQEALEAADYATSVVEGEAVYVRVKKSETD